MDFSQYKRKDSKTLQITDISPHCHKFKPQWGPLGSSIALQAFWIGFSTIIGGISDSTSKMSETPWVVCLRIPDVVAT